MLQRKAFLFAWAIFIVPYIFLGFLFSYLNLLENSSRMAVGTSPVSWIALATLQLIFLFLWYRMRTKLHSWLNRGKPAETEIIKAVVMFPKMILYIGILQAFIFPQAMLFSVPDAGLMFRFHFSLLAFASTMFFGMPFYILFLQNFEECTREIPFDRNIMSMSLTLRTNLVVFFLMISLLTMFQLGIRYSLDSHMSGMDIDRFVLSRLMPLELVGVLMSLLNMYLLMRGIRRRIDSCEAFATGLAEGDFSSRQSYCLSRDELGSLNHELYLVYQHNAGLLKQLGSAVNKTIASKDGIIHISSDTTAAIEQISGQIDSVNNLMELLNSSIGETTSSTSALKQHIQALEQDVVEQNNIVGNSSEAIGEISSSIDNISAVAGGKIQSAEQLVTVSREGAVNVQNTVESISQVHASIENIRDMLSLIQSIAAQTNLLAMNAAIEAAHAGDAGRGFAVVAEEIRKLAENSSDSSKKIHAQIKDIVDTIEQTSLVGKTASESFHRISDGIDEMIVSFREIHQGLGELKQDSSQVLKSVSSLRQNSKHVQDSTAHMSELTATVDNAMQSIEAVSRETRSAAKEMRSGANGVRSVSGHMVEQSSSLEQASSLIEQGLEKFKF